MSPTNRDRTERGYAALARRDLEAFLELVDPDVEFTSLIAESEGQTYRGHVGVRQWWEQVVDALGGLRFRVEHLREVGDRVLVTIDVTGHVEGVDVSQTMYQVLRVREGRAVSWHSFRTREEALVEVEQAA